VHADSGNKSTGEEFRFRVVFKFSRDINTSKLGSKTAIFKEIVDNFARLGKKLVGVLEVYLKDSRNIVAIGDRENDFILIKTNSWHVKIFDGVDFSVSIEKITPDTAETMLMGTTRNVISPNGLEELKSNYGISRIQQKGGGGEQV